MVTGHVVNLESQIIRATDIKACLIFTSVVKRGSWRARCHLFIRTLLQLFSFECYYTLLIRQFDFIRYYWTSSHRPVKPLDLCSFCSVCPLCLSYADVIRDHCCNVIKIIIKIFVKDKCVTPLARQCIL